MVEISLTQMTELENTRWSELARRNVAFFAVALACLDPEWPIPSSVADDVAEVLSLMDAASGYSADWFMGQKEDFTQYIPRGHYTKTTELSNFFKAMMWLGRISLRISPSDEGFTPQENNERGS